MKGKIRIRLIVSAAVLAVATGVRAGESKPPAKVLSDAMFAQMDANTDSKVSRDEYVEFGTAYLKKKRMRVNRRQLDIQFAEFDRDSDGFITSSDPAYKRPQELLKEKIAGTWTCTKTKSETPTLAVTISNTTTHPDTYRLEWYSYAKLPTGDRIITNDSGSENITVGARNSCKEFITPTTMTLTETTVEQEFDDGGTSDPRITETGRINAGYLVLLKHGDTILDKKASSKNYLADEWLARL
jgi:hypothetical protein